jgi:hypothetical protein
MMPEIHDEWKGSSGGKAPHFREACNFSTLMKILSNKAIEIPQEDKLTFGINGQSGTKSIWCLKL